MVSLPYTTKEGYAILLYRLKDSDASKYNHEVIVKTVAMYADVKVSEFPIQNGYILISDPCNLTISHAKQMRIHLARLSGNYYQVCAQSTRWNLLNLTSIKFSGSPSISIKEDLRHEYVPADKKIHEIPKAVFVGWIKIPNSLFARTSGRHPKGTFTCSKKVSIFLVFHRNFVSRLFQDYGGNLPTIEEMYKQERKLMETYREWLIGTSATKPKDICKHRPTDNIEFDWYTNLCDLEQNFTDKKC